MWGLDSLGLPIGADGSITLPLWVAGIAAALVLAVFILALIRARLAGTLVFIALAGFGIWAASAWADRERVDQRRALEQQLAVLEAQALAPASVLACLDASGDTMEAGCERTIFASPETAAAVMSFTAARLLLLQEGLAFAARRDATFENAVESLRKSLETDRYGVVAQVLTARHGCSPEPCDPLRLLRDATRVRANMRDRTFETNVSRYAASWPTRATSVSTAPDGSGTIPAAGTIPGTVAAPVPPRYTLPSAASIPPVSIMSNEPAAATPPAATPSMQSPATGAAPSAPAPRRPPPPRPQAATPASPPPPLPMPLGPSGPPRP